MVAAALSLETAGRGLEDRLVLGEQGGEQGDEKAEGVHPPPKSKKVQFSPWTPQGGSV